MPDIDVTPQLVADHGLTPDEYQKLVEELGREPNLTELGIFSVMWSEHCSYKSSRFHLKKLPTTGPQVIEGPGENAGVVDIGGGMAAVFKIESHNHPSFIEPYQGAATGVGGILRDVFTMGARPVALLNSLHFGPLSDPRNQRIMEGVVAGIGGYGNCVGVPTVGGEVHFHPSYSANPLVNAFCLGVAPAEKIFRARAAGDGNPVIYVGAKTGRDGIHGATMASEEFSEDSEAKRPTVQVGDPFLEKLLLEACLEAMRSGAVVGIQDMGAAGLTCSSCEMGANEGKGIEIDLSRVPQRETGMTPYETMLSESQERMLIVAERGREQEVLDIFARWDLDAVVIGTVRPEPDMVVRRGDEEVAHIPNASLTDAAPLYERPTRRPEALDEIPDWREVERPSFSTFDEPLAELLASPHLASRRWVYRQYDHMVRTNTVVLPGADAAVVRVRETGGAIAMSLDSNARFAALDPREAARLTVAENCRNLVTTGARPLAATNCLNFASPENPEVMWQFAETVEGLRVACEAFGTPITGGNVSFYNETKGAGVLPTPVLGIIGLIDDVERICRPGFRSIGDVIYLLGSTEPSLGGSLFLEVIAGEPAGPCPTLDVEAELALQRVVLDGVSHGLFRSAHDVSEGGLACALAECCFERGLGARCEIGPLTEGAEADAALFGEGPSRVIVSVSSEREPELLEAAAGIPSLRLGEVRGDALAITGGERPLVDSPVAHVKELREGSLTTIFRH